jgi:hypothetical protein
MIAAVVETVGARSMGISKWLEHKQRSGLEPAASGQRLVLLSIHHHRT